GWGEGETRVHKNKREPTGGPRCMRATGTYPTSMKASTKKAEPARLMTKNCCAPTPLKPATAGITCETPGSHLEKKRVRLALFSKNIFDLRTQVSGSKEMRQSKPSTRSPFLRTNSYQTASPTTQASKPT